MLHTFESARAAANMINKVKLETGTGKLRIRNVAMHSLHMAATTTTTTTNGKSDTWRCQLGTVFKAPPHTHTHTHAHGHAWQARFHIYFAAAAPRIASAGHRQEGGLRVCVGVRVLVVVGARVCVGVGV